MQSRNKLLLALTSISSGSVRKGCFKNQRSLYLNFFTSGFLQSVDVFNVTQKLLNGEREGIWHDWCKGPTEQVYYAILCFNF